MLNSEAAGLAIKIAKGLIKTASRIDVMLAEKEALQGPLSFPLAEVNMMAAETLMADFRNRVWLREMIRNYKITAQALELPPALAWKPDWITAPELN